ncbi:MAG: hypothetical protein PVH19_04455 [Planctomycetia bacterium]|jgi:hypothetical protein
MQLIAILGVIVISLLILLGTAGCSRKPGPPSSPNTTAESVKTMSPEELNEKLQKVEKQEKPEENPINAMCYDIDIEALGPIDQSRYNCPACGERTIYATKDADDVDEPSEEVLLAIHLGEFFKKELPACRRELAALQHLTDWTLSLEESSFCRHCWPDAEKRELGLVIAYPNGKTHSVSPIEYNDLLLLRDFFADQLLDRNAPRLRELLGTEPEENFS